MCRLIVNRKGMDVNVSSGVSPAARFAKPTVGVQHASQEARQ
ncbi:MAG: hypothetical protein K0S98_1172, partial [Propionibacteriaceae bacterium]|nr:hypothetical protein [Propionibacteriaceae bacterium]